MIRWIQSRHWLPNVVISTIFLIIFSAIEYSFDSMWSLAVTATIAAAIFFTARLPYVAAALMLASLVLAIFFNLGLISSFFGFLVALYLVATSAKIVARFLVLIIAIVGPTVLVVMAEPKALETNLGFVQLLELAVLLVFPLLVFLSGRLAITRVVHVGTSQDQRIASRTSSAIALRVAEQEERFQIAREIAEVILQEITAVLSQAEGGAYAAKLDASVAPRVLEKVAVNARSAHQELRRLYDQLNRNLGIQAAPPGIDDLAEQIVLLREFGYTANLKHSGTRFALSEGAELAIYRLVFDALENVKDHVPAGSSVSVDFTWVDEGMQVLIKDNGIETANRAAATIAEIAGEQADTSYSIQDDLEALVKPITGASITAMRERAALYGGAVEVASVPGVGFTVSAIFPQLRNLAGIDEVR